MKDNIIFAFLRLTKFHYHCNGFLVISIFQQMGYNFILLIVCISRIISLPIPVLMDSTADNLMSANSPKKQLSGPVGRNF